MCENYKRSAPERVRILACAIVRAKMVFVTEFREIAQEALIGQIMNNGSGRARNRTSRLFRPNNEYWKRSRVKIINERSREGLDIRVCDCAHEMLPSQNHAKSHRWHI